MDINNSLIKIAPSMLACDFTCLGEEMLAVINAGADYIHWDVMDGQFVDNISIGVPVIASARKQTDAVFDVHLMVNDALRYIDVFAKAGADIITVHVEAEKDLLQTLRAIKSLNKKAGIALSPDTELSVITDEHLSLADMVLIMTVNPGFGGQPYMDMTTKIQSLHERIKALGLEIEIEVDGGINQDTAKDVINAGATVLVAGTAVFGKDDYACAINKLRNSMNVGACSNE